MKIRSLVRILFGLSAAGLVLGLPVLPGYAAPPRPKPVITISNDKASIGPDVAVSTEGVSVAAWIGATGRGPQAVKASLGIMTGTSMAWSAPATLTGLEGAAAAPPSVSISADGSTVAAAWAGADHAIWVVTGAVSDGVVAWQESVSLGADGSFPQVAVDTHASGTSAVVVWETSAGQISASTFDGSVWSAAERISTGTGTANAAAARIAISGSSAVAVWYQEVSSQFQIRSAALTGGTWSAPTTVNALSCDDAYDPEVALSRDGSSAVVAWECVGASSSTVQTAFVDPDTGELDGVISELGGGAAPGAVPQVAISATGDRASVAWLRTNDLGNRVVATSSYAASAWGAAVQLSRDDRDAETVRLASSGNGQRAAVVWGQFGLNRLTNLKVSTGVVVADAWVWAAAKDLDPTAGSRSPSIGMADDGRLLAVWQVDQGIGLKYSATIRSALIPASG